MAMLLSRRTLLERFSRVAIGTSFGGAVGLGRTEEAWAAPNTSSPYLLPWPGGETFKCIQGNNGTFSHTGLEAYAWDFAMPVGSVVLTARGGRVRFVYQESDVGGVNWQLYADKGNYVVVDHGDGTSALYLHLMYHGSLVRVGQTVQQGQPIAYSGETGFTSMPHLHFMVEHSSPFDPYTQSIPVTFRDVSTGGGVPQTGGTYTSGNAHVAVTHAPVVIKLMQTTVPSAPAVVPTQPVLPAERFSGIFVTDVNFPDGSSVKAGREIQKTWRVRNAGTVAWPAGTHLELQGINGFKLVSLAPVPLAIPQQAVDLTVTLRASAMDGAAGAYFRLADGSGTEFGNELWIRASVTGEAPTASAPWNPKGRYYFAQTGHNIMWPFDGFFAQYGGLNAFGYPRTEALHEDGLLVQYFQRGRMEYHPELPQGQQIQLTLLGTRLTQDQQPFPKAAPSPTTATNEFFPQTGHSVSFGFLAYYRAHGGLPIFGYPISEEFPLAGVPGGTAQWFQRARLEYRPQLLGTPYAIQPGLLGDEYLTEVLGWLPLPAYPTKTLPPPATPHVSAPIRTPTPTVTVSVNASGPARTASVTTSGLRVHSSPSITAPIIGYLSQGNQVSVLQQANGWALVRMWNNRQGYVSTAYLKLS
ncbi:MAG: NBR1-Ig-like domain-containing protein [Chloroflexi bacterium]|nr:NBR1-Ig-like domain-containing protein [Chloroflexota bacterium]